MNKTLRILLMIGAVLVIAAGLVGAGFFIGRTAWGWNAFHPGGMMGSFDHSDLQSQLGYGMMGERGYAQKDVQQLPYGHGGMGSGMMGGGMMGGSGGAGMMGGFGTSTNADPLSTEDSLKAVEAYLADLGNDDLAVAEIMVFDNNSYAIVVEESTGIGAFELLVNPATKAVYPEYGPNMMWNLKYGMHAGSGFGGGMMGGYGDNDSGELPEVSTEMTVSEDQALEYAQSYLDTNNPGVTVSDEITAFYGYYTIDLEQDGAIVGMLSVNGFSGQVFPHTWHGAFIEMLETGHE